MDISARAFSLPDRPRLGHLGHQCSHALGRPNLHLVSSSRRPRLETVDRVTSSLAPHAAQFLCSSQGPFLRPGPRNVDRVARRGGQRRPSRLACGGPPPRRATPWTPPTPRQPKTRPPPSTPRPPPPQTPPPPPPPPAHTS